MFYVLMFHTEAQVFLSILCICLRKRADGDIVSVALFMSFDTTLTVDLLTCCTCMCLACCVLCWHSNTNEVWCVCWVFGMYSKVGFVISQRHWLTGPLLNCLWQTATLTRSGWLAYWLFHLLLLISLLLLYCTGPERYLCNDKKKNHEKYCSMKFKLTRESVQSLPKIQKIYILIFLSLLFPWVL